VLFHPLLQIGYTEATFNDNTRAALRSSLATVGVIPSSLTQLFFYL
jgi:hypothetical protein